jgi:hypothetical protein
MVPGEKVRKPMKRNKKFGKRWGRKKIPWEIQKGKDLRATGKGWRQIAQDVGVSSTLARARKITMPLRRAQRPLGYEML